MDVPDFAKDYGPIAGVVLTVWFFLKYASPWTAAVTTTLQEMRVLLVEVRDLLRRFNDTHRGN